MSFRRPTPLLLTLLLAACAAQHGAPAPAARPALGQPAFAEPARLQSDVEWLSADAREGRRAGTQAARECALWLAERLRSLGLEPAGEQGFLQEFPIALPAQPGPGTRLAIAGQALSAAEVRPLIYSESGEVSGALVDCGFGIEIATDQHTRNDFESADPKGQIALVRRGTPL